MASLLHVQRSSGGFETRDSSSVGPKTDGNGRTKATGPDPTGRMAGSSVFVLDRTHSWPVIRRWWGYAAA